MKGKYPPGPPAPSSEGRPMYDQMKRHEIEVLRGAGFALTVSLTVQSMETFFRTVSTSCLAISRREVAPKTRARL
jgi:hypothetical protein